MASVKDAARQLIEQLPEQATWDDIMYAFYMKQKIEAGLADIAVGRTVAHDTLIAAHAVSLSATLITNNSREFTRVTGLRVKN